MLVRRRKRFAKQHMKPLMPLSESTSFEATGARVIYETPDEQHMQVQRQRQMQQQQQQQQQQGIRFDHRTGLPVTTPGHAPVSSMQTSARIAFPPPLPARQQPQHPQSAQPAVLNTSMQPVFHTGQPLIGTGSSKQFAAGISTQTSVRKQLGPPIVVTGSSLRQAPTAADQDFRPYSSESERETGERTSGAVLPAEGSGDTHYAALGSGPPVVRTSQAAPTTASGDDERTMGMVIPENGQRGRAKRFNFGKARKK